MNPLLKNELKNCLVLLWGITTVVASAGAMNSGNTLYLIAGIANIGFSLFGAVRYAKEHFKAHRDE